MISKFAIAAVLAAGVTVFAASSRAEDFPAAPIQAGPPRNLPGENFIPGAQQAVDLVNAVTQPILQPILVPGGDAPVAAASAPHHRHHARHVAGHASHHRRVASLSRKKKTS